MRLKFKIAFFLAASFILVAVTSILAQEQASVAESASEQDDGEMQWVWGEVVSVDTANKSVVVKCLDYETDQEKNMIVLLDDKTLYDNIKTIDEIKPKDTLSIDYIVKPGDKNIARNVSKETAEVVGDAEQQQTPVPDQQQAVSVSQTPAGQ
jgi:hypothetical protein